MSQTERIIYIDKQLSQKRHLTCKQVADQFEISTRQVKRDIEYLRDRFFAPIIYDYSQKFYKYETQFSLTNSKDDNTLIFKAVFDNFSKANGLKPLSSSLIEEGIDNTLDENERNLSKKILFISPIVDLPNKDIFSLVSLAMKNNSCLTFRYTDLKNETTKRYVEPLRLVNNSKAWYLIAYDKNKKGLRNFHLSRVQKPEQINTDITYRENIEELEKYISSGFGIFMNKISYNAVIEFKEKAVNIVKTQTWHKNQRVVIKNNKLYMKLPFSSFDEILSKILSFASLAKPIEPPKLVAQWQAEIKKMQDLI